MQRGNYALREGLKMPKGVHIDDFIRAGGKLGKEARKAQTPLIDALALRVLGVLADAPTQTIRRKALEKARRMMGRR